ncbi:MAG: response regulator [Piscinibacter sp.]
MSRPRVLLVDDDAAIRRFVAMALEDMDIELVQAAGVPQAREALRGAPFRLIVTDLMMPGETGYDLLQHLADHPAQRAGARLAVFSAGIGADMQARLDALGVWRRLPKPTSLTELERCVADALGGDARGSTPAPAAAPLADSERAAIVQHFGGDEALFLAYRASCLAQFANDLRAGDAALAGADAAALRRLAHSLKSVLATLGRASPSMVARELEDSAARADWAASTPLWYALRDQLRSGS